MRCRGRLKACLNAVYARELDKLESESSRVRHDTEMLRVTYEAQLEAEKASAQGRLVSLDAELRSRDARLSSMRQEYDGKVATLEDTVLQVLLRAGNTTLMSA